MTSNILYWHGFGHKKDELNIFKKCFVKKCFSIEEIKENYDFGLICPNDWRWLKSTRYDWWIGMSLGASVMVYSLRFLSTEAYPTRITMINPFYSRKELSIENSFSMSNQMDFCLDKDIRNIRKSELVLSVYDEKIKMNHGIRVLNHFTSDDKKIIFVSSNHIIGNEKAQIELANILQSGYDNAEKKYNYCNVYNQL